MPGTTDTGNHCLDCTTNIAMPFPVKLYGQTSGSANISSHGTLQFLTGDVTYENTCLPYPNFGYAIVPYWDDINTASAGSGVFTSVSGSAPATLQHRMAGQLFRRRSR